MATITGNSVYADPTQWWTLDYTFANSKFTWSVTAHASFTSYWNSIYGLTVNVGGNSYYKGDIDWRNYTPNTVVYSGTTNLSDCTVQNGVVTLSVSGNFYYGTWSADYRSSGSGTCAVDPPTVDALTYSATNKYSNMVVSGRSVITFTMKGTSRTGSTSMSYSLYQDNSVISTTTGTSGTAKTVNVTAPAAGSHNYKYVATDGNGTTTMSGNISITTYAYTPPAFSSVSAVRWSTGNSSGTASDEGTYCKATANFSKGKVGTTAITTTCTIKVDTYTGTATNGTAIWLGGGNLSADNTYSVTFTLSDGYGNNVVTTDTLTQGGRGIDLIYGSGHYGVAIGQKATANQFDVNLSTYIQGVPMGNTSVPSSNQYPSGGTLTQAVSNLYTGFRFYGNGTNRYCKIATITISYSYRSGIITLYCIGRNFRSPITVLIQFAHANTTDPSLSLLRADNYAENFYMVKTATSTWELWCDTGTTYGTLAVWVTKGDYNITLTPDIAMNMTGATSLPAGTTQGTTTNYAAVTNAVTRSSGWSISGQRTSRWGRVNTISLWFAMASSGTGYTGNSAFVGSVVSPYIPLVGVTGAGYFSSNNSGSHSFSGLINNDGSINIHFTDDVTYSGGYAYISWTFVN